MHFHGRARVGLFSIFFLFATVSQAQQSGNFFEQLFGGGQQQRRPQPQPRGDYYGYGQRMEQEYARDAWGRPVRPEPRRNSFLGWGSDDDQQPPTSTSGDNAAYHEFDVQRERSLPMYVQQSEWTPQHEILFGQFVNQLGKAIKSGVCNTVKNCMQNPTANMYASSDPNDLILYSDCADYPYFLRAYFAYKNNLPFAYVNDLAMAQAPFSSIADRDADFATAQLDNSPYGNIIEGRGGANVPASPGQEKNLLPYLHTMFDMVSTRTFRVGPFNQGAQLSDVYPVKLDRNGVQAGTVVSTTGHMYIVFDVDNAGTVHMIDAHPDGSTSYKTVKSSTLDRSRPDHGLGFFRFRPLHLVGAKMKNGAYYGGKVVTATNDELVAQGVYSLEQFYGPGSTLVPTKAGVDPELYKSAFNKVGFFEYLRMHLRNQDSIVAADQTVAESLDSLCTEFKQRIEDVEASVKKELYLQQHPDTISANIYSSPDETWESYSTPSRDGRLRASATDIVKTAVDSYRRAKKGGEGLSFAGSATDYQTAVRQKLADMNQKCVMAYTKSDGTRQGLNFANVLSRLNKISFDPYHCPEKRWGATGKEMNSCRDGDQDDAWYKGEQAMRNTVGKSTPSEKLIIRSPEPISLALLQDPSLIDQPETSDINMGTAKAPLMNIDGFFASPNFLNLLNK